MPKIFIDDPKYVIYFYGQPYKRASAGITTLYRTCDYLNRSGIPSYMVVDGSILGKLGYSKYHSSGNLITPKLTESELDRHVNENRIPIVVYPEVVIGNPLGAKNVVRYLLYFDKTLINQCVVTNPYEGIIYFSDSIYIDAKLDKKEALFKQKISFPIQDPLIYEDLRENYETVGAEEYYYCEKFINALGRRVPDIIATQAIRITRDQTDSYTQDELRSRLSKARLLHAFEDTAVIYEALLAGCVVNVHPDGYFPNDGWPLAVAELGTSGLLKTSEKITDIQIRDKKKELSNFQSEYNRWVESGENDIDDFAKQCKKFTKKFDEKLLNLLYENLVKYEFYFQGCKTNNRKKIFFLPIATVQGLAKFLVSKKFRPSIKRFVRKIYYSILLRSPDFLRRRIIKLKELCYPWAS